MNEITNGAARLWTPEFLSMSGSNFLLFISQYIMIAALPIYIMDSLGGGELEAGMAMTFFQIGTVTARPLAGRLIDGIDKRRLLRIVAVLFIVIMGAFLVLPGLMGIYGLRLAHGALFAVATTAAAALAVLVLPPERKGTGIGYFALSTNLAMVVGPMLGLLIIGGLGARVMFAFLTACAVLTAVLLLWRKLPDEIMQPSRRRRKGLSLRDFFERRSVPAAFLGGLVFFAYGGVLTFLPLYARSLGMQEETSLFYAVFAAVIVVSRPLIGRMFDRFGPDATVWPGFVAFGLGMVLLGSVESLVGPRIWCAFSRLPDACCHERPACAQRSRDSDLFLVARYQRRLGCCLAWVRCHGLRIFIPLWNRVASRHRGECHLLFLLEKNGSRRSPS